MPPEITTVSPVPIGIDPVVVKLGLTPDCWIVSLAFTLIVPPLLCTADAFVSASGWLTASVP